MHNLCRSGTRGQSTHAPRFLWSRVSCKLHCELVSIWKRFLSKLSIYRSGTSFTNEDIGTTNCRDETKGHLSRDEKILRRLEDYSVTMKTRKYKEREFMSTNANVLKEYRRIRRMAIQSRLRYHRYRRFVGTCVPSTVSFATWQAMDRRKR